MFSLRSKDVDVGPARPKRSFASRWFGYDIFISFALGPPPRGTQSYASDLARRLRERDFTVFFSEDEAPPGDELDGSLVTALHRSTTVVVIANRGTLAEPRWIRKEVEEFRSRHPSRPVIPINVGGALQDPALAENAQDWLRFRDRIWLDESSDAVETGIASEALVERLATAPTRFKSNVGWRWVVRATVAILGILVVALGVAAKMARDSAAQARAELRRAVSTSMVAEAQLMLADQRAGGDERALLQLLAAHRIAPGAAADGGLLAGLLQRGNLTKLMTTPSSVMAVAYSPDGSRIVSGGGDGILRLWDAKTLQPLSIPFGKHEGGIASLAYGPRDGSRIVSASTNGSLRLWNAGTGQPLVGPFGSHKGWVVKVIYSPDGSRIVSVDGADSKLRRWDGLTGEALGEALKGQSSGVTTIEYSPDGSRIASASIDGTLRLWDADTGEPLGDPRKGHADAVISLAYNLDGSRIVSASQNGTLRLWDANSGEPIGNPHRAHERAVASVAFSPDGSRVVSGSGDHTLRVWDTKTWKPASAPLKGHRDMVWSVAYSPDGIRIVSAGAGDKTLRLWDAKTSQFLGVPLAGPPVGAASVAFSPDGTRIVVGGGSDNALHRWDAKTRQPILPPLSGHERAVYGVAYSRDGSRIVSSSDDKTLRVWNAETGQLVGAPIEAGDSVMSVAYSPDGRRIVSSHYSGVRLWDAKTGQVVGDRAKVAGHTGWVNSVAYSPDGSRVVSSADNDPTLHLWDATTGRPSDDLKGRGSGVSTVVYSPDGNRIASGGLDGMIRLWDAKTGRPSGGPLGDPLAGLEGSVRSIAYSGDSRLIVSGHGDGALRLWDATTGQAIGVPLAGHNDVRSVSYSSDGRRIVSAGWDTMRLWPAPQAWPDELCAKLTLNLSRSQWREWVSPAVPYACQCPGLPISPDAANMTATPERCPGDPAQSMFH